MLPNTDNRLQPTELLVRPENLTIENGGYIWMEETQSQDFNTPEVRLNIALPVETGPNELYIADSIIITEEEAETLRKLEGGELGNEPTEKDIEVLTTINYTIAAFCIENHFDPRALANSHESTRIQPAPKYSEHVVSQTELEHYEQFEEMLMKKGNPLDYQPEVLAFHQYLKYKPVSRFKEIKLIRDMRFGSIDAAKSAEEEIIGSQIRWVFRIVRKFKAKDHERLAKIPDTDLFQEAMIATWDIIHNKFDLNKRTSLDTFLLKGIMWGLNRFVNQNWSTIRTSDHADDKVKAAMRTSENGVNGLRETETVTAAINAASSISIESLEEASGDDSSAGDIIYSMLPPHQRDPRIAEVFDFELKDYVEKFGNYFTEEERTVLMMRRDGYLDREIAEHLGFSRQRTSQVRAVAEKRLKHLVRGTVNQSDMSTVHNFIKLHPKAFNNWERRTIKQLAKGDNLEKAGTKLGLSREVTKHQQRTAIAKAIELSQKQITQQDL